MDDVFDEPTAESFPPARPFAVRFAMASLVVVAVFVGARLTLPRAPASPAAVDRDGAVTTDPTTEPDEGDHLPTLDELWGRAFDEESSEQEHPRVDEPVDRTGDTVSEWRRIEGDAGSRAGRWTMEVPSTWSSSTAAPGVTMVSSSSLQRSVGVVVARPKDRPLRDTASSDLAGLASQFQDPIVGELSETSMSGQPAVTAELGYRDEHGQRATGVLAWVADQPWTVYLLVFEVPRVDGGRAVIERIFDSFSIKSLS